jgi:hypothetical protein
MFGEGVEDTVALDADVGSVVVVVVVVGGTGDDDDVDEVGILLLS